MNEILLGQEQKYLEKQSGVILDKKKYSIIVQIPKVIDDIISNKELSPKQYIELKKNIPNFSGDSISQELFCDMIKNLDNFKLISSSIYFKEFLIYIKGNGYLDLINQKFELDKGKAKSLFKELFENFLQEQDINDKEKYTNDKEKHTNDKEKYKQIQQDENNSFGYNVKKNEEFESDIKSKQNIEKQEIFEKINNLEKQAQQLSQKFNIKPTQEQIDQQINIIKTSIQSKGIELSNEQINQIAYSATIKELISSNISIKNDNLVKSFLGEYDKISAWLGIKDTLQSSEFIKNNNQSVKQFIEKFDDTQENKFENSQIDEILLKQIDNSLTNEEKQKQILEKKQQLKQFINYTNNTAAFDGFYNNLKNIFGDYFEKSFGSLDKEKNFCLKDGVFEANINIDGVDIELKILSDGKIQITDYLNNINGGFKSTEKTINSFSFLTAYQLKNLGQEINFVEIFKQTDGNLDKFKQDYKKVIEDNISKQIKNQKTNFIETEIKYEIGRTQTYNKLINFYKPPENFDGFLKNGSKEITQEKNFNEYNYLEILKNSLNYNSLIENEKLINIFEQIQNFIVNNKDKLSQKPNNELLEKFKNNGGYLEFINEFLKKNSDNKFIIDIDKLERFKQATLENKEFIF